MGIRTGANAPLGCPAIDAAHDVAGIALGTIISGYDDENDVTNEYMFVLTGADHSVGEDVDVTTDGTYTTSDATADTGTADAVVASTSGQYVWVQLKTRQPLA